MNFLSESDSPTRDHFRILTLSWAGWVFDFYDLILFTFLLIPIGKELSLSNISLSLVLGSSLGATAIGGILFGFLSDKFGRRSVLQWTILTYSIGTFLSGFATSTFVLLVFRIITGLGVGGEWATGQTFIGETFPAKIRGRYSAIMQTGAPIGIIFASLVGGFLEPVAGWRMCFFVSVLPAVLIVFVRRHLPESDIWLEHKRIVTEAETLKADKGKADKEPSLSLLEREGGSKLALLLSKAYGRTFIRSLLLAVFLMSAYWFTYSWLPGYLHEQRHFPLTRSALWMIMTQGGGVLGYVSFGFAADKLGRRQAFTIYSFLWAIGLLMITLFWTAVIDFPGVILGFMFLVGFGTGVFSGFGPLCAELFPTSIRNTAMGTAFNLARGIQFFTPVIITVASKTYGLSGGISIAALFAVLTGIWIWIFPETKGRKIALLATD